MLNKNRKVKEMAVEAILVSRAHQRRRAMELSTEMKQALDNPAVHYFAKDIIKAGINKDINDVLNDLEYCQYLFKKHLEDTLKKLGDTLQDKGV